jgi:hypothetical protein
MPQKTNLNVFPYFDDYNQDNIYHKVLFKPGYPIQARELTTLQSILQTQIERFGNWAFQEGSPVIPGKIVYNDRYYAVELKNSFNGININQYLSSIIGTTIRGEKSGVRAKVISAISDKISVRNNTTIYVNFIDSDFETSEYMGFSDGENLLLEQNVTAYITIDPDSIINLQANEAFASTIDVSCNSVGSTLLVESGVYFIRGYFVKNDSQFILLDQYGNFPSYKVGFLVTEDIITSEDDNSLNDNAKGFLNYAAPGADRFAISLVLTKIAPDEEIPENFIQLVEIIDGIVRSIQRDPRLNELGKELARRTYDESGDYYVKPPTITVEESLNNLLGNDGIYSGNQLTFNGNVPSEDLGVYSISPLKAYVKGYEVETVSSTLLDFKKARTTKRLENQSILYNTGSTISLNRVYGSPVIGISTTYTISLRDERKGTNSGISVGKEIGVARVYDFALESGSYNSSLPDVNQWEINVYDVQTFTEISVNETITLNESTYVKGKSSGAVGYLKYGVSNSGILTAYNTSGFFISGEKIIFNGVEDEKTRVTTSVKSYTLDQVKSLYGIVGVANTFSADIVQIKKRPFGIADISPLSSGISTISVTSAQFPGVVKINDLVSYTIPGKSDVTYSKVQTVNPTSLVVVGVTTVNGICDGALPNSSTTVTDLSLLGSNSLSVLDEKLYTILPKSNISNVDLSNSSLTIRKQFDVTITSNSTGNVVASDNEKFLPFDEERYVLITSNGTIERLSSDKFDSTSYSSSGGSIIKFNGLETTSGNARLIATLTKSKLSQKIKNKSIVKSIIIDKSKLVGSGIGETTLNNGLVYGNYPYGTRVEDEELCLLRPDVVGIYGIFELNDTSNLSSDPKAPRLTLSNISGNSASTNDFNVGETLIGEISSAVAVCVGKINSSTIEFTYLNSETFIIGESIKFKNSLVSASVNSIEIGDKNITSNYVLDDGQRNNMYDYSRIIRKSQYKEPIRKIKIYFESSEYSSSDTGDITTVNSYQNFDYSQIPSVNQNRNSDIIDIRPKVSPYVVAENQKSPFEFSSRNFSVEYNNSSKYILASDESIICSYSYYLPRIDSIYLSKDGIFQVRVGDPSDDPQLPIPLDESIEIARAFIPAYTFNTTDISITRNEYKRYTMSDIGSLEQRIKNLEYYTSLSLLEKDTASLVILDQNGNTRFKSGFFVDNFTTTIYQQKDTIVKNSINVNLSELRPTHYTTNCDLVIGETSLILDKNNSVDIEYSEDFISTNIKKTGNVVTLDYDEVVENTQQFSTRVVDVFPYETSEYNGSIILNPSSDVWISQNKVKPNSIQLNGDLTENDAQIEVTQDNQETGFNPVEWNSSSKYWKYNQKPQKSQTFNPKSSKNNTNKGKYFVDNDIKTSTKKQNINAIKTSSSFNSLPKIGNSEQISSTTSVISNELIPYMRSRNIEFKAERLKPFTRMYPFFDSKNVNEYIIPKLIEISMVNGKFVAGEVVICRIQPKSGAWIGDGSKKSGRFKQIFSRDGNPINNLSDVKNVIPYQLISSGISTNSSSYFKQSQLINNFSNTMRFSGPLSRFRICAPNHKIGPYNSPTKKYYANPYDRSQVISDSYSTTSTILNIDTFSLSYSGQSNLYGYIRIGMQLVGETSGAIATVTDIKLVTDEVGSLIGSFKIPNNEKNRFTAGEKVFRLSNSSVNDFTPGVVFSSAEEKFYAQGTLNSIQETVLSVSKPRIAPEIPTPPPPSVGPSVYAPPPSTPSQPSSPSAPKPVNVAPTANPVPSSPPPTKINFGSPVYANAAQNRLVNAANDVLPGNYKNIEQVAKELGIKVNYSDGGNVTQKSGDKITAALQSQGANIVPGPGSKPDKNSNTGSNDKKSEGKSESKSDSKGSDGKPRAR